MNQLRLLTAIGLVSLFWAGFGHGQGDGHTQRIYLSGKGPSDAVDWDFYCSGGRRSGEWTKIPVPSNWEQQGFGNYDYGHVPPEEKHEEVGIYRTSFMVPEEWKDRHVRLMFEGAMTETSIKVNGIPVGAPNLGGYLPFQFPLDASTQPDNKNVLKYGTMNELEVRVAKKPSNRSVDLAERKGDYWVFGGIYRPVYLEVLPKVFINRVAIDARADGRLVMEIFPQEHRDIKSGNRTDLELVDAIEARILNLDGSPVGEIFSTQIPGPVSRVRLETKISNPVLWSPESPQLYQVRTRLKKADKTVHERLDTFGFRTFALRPGDGLYLNGTRLLIKGINRNVFHPDTARAIDPEMAWEDARQIKAMNANLVRSHLPPTGAFMEACDRLGLLVIPELTNWHVPVMDTPVARNLVYELVMKYQNHPSTILWANGNEGGFNKEVDELYPLYDIQDRPRIHPWAVFGGIDAKHYPNYDQLKNVLEGPRIVLPTEFLHGLYDGGHGAGLADYWNLMKGSPKSAGGVLWCWADAGLARTDLNGKIDTAGNYSADGLVGPYREREASYYTVREIWSPVQIPLEEIPSDFDGTLPLKNHYLFSTLDACMLEWRLVSYSRPLIDEAEVIVSAQGRLQPEPVRPGDDGAVRLPLPADWRSCDALVVRATDHQGNELMQWSWPLRADMEMEKEWSQANGIKQIGPMEFEAGKVAWSFNPGTGHLTSCSVDGREIGLGSGPVLYVKTEKGVVNQPGSWKVETIRNKDTVVIVSTNIDDESSFSWTLSAKGSAELAYAFAPIPDPVTYCAVGFDLPETAISSKRWLGDGPYRVWANRRKGPQFGLWENDYNDSIPGVRWDYPAFKGIFDNVDWMVFDLSSGATLLMQPENRAALGVLHPSNVKEPDVDKQPNQGPRKATWDYPEGGGLFLFHKLPAVGTKFKIAEALGPQSQPETILQPLSGKVWFYIFVDQ